MGEGRGRRADKTKGKEKERKKERERNRREEINRVQQNFVELWTKYGRFLRTGVDLPYFSPEIDPHRRGTRQRFINFSSCQSILSRYTRFGPVRFLSRSVEIHRDIERLSKRGNRYQTRGRERERTSERVRARERERKKRTK